MDKNELNLKVEELKTAMHNRDFEKAVDIADTLELRKIKDNNFLSLVADAYELTHNYKEARKALQLAYENTNAGRNLAYRLCLVSIKCKEFDDAREYYEDFVELAPRDTSRYILKYKMAKAQGTSVEKLIDILEEYVNIDMDEKWAYELVKLYHMAGDEEKCVDMCDEISLWFADGKYVVKAMGIKRMYRPLTPSQQFKYEKAQMKQLDDAKDIQKSQEPEDAAQPIKIDETEIEGTATVHNAETMQPGAIDNTDTMQLGALEGTGAMQPGIVDNIDAMQSGMTEDMEITQRIPPVREEVTQTTGPKENFFGKSIEVEEITASETIDEMEVLDELEELDELDDSDENLDETNIMVEPIKDINGVEDILRQLQARGILKAETVEQAVNIIDSAGKRSLEEETSEDELMTEELTSEDELMTEKISFEDGLLAEKSNAGDSLTEELPIEEIKTISTMERWEEDSIDEDVSAEVPEDSISDNSEADETVETDGIDADNIVEDETAETYDIEPDSEEESTESDNVQVDTTEVDDTESYTKDNSEESSIEKNEIEEYSSEHDNEKTKEIPVAVQAMDLNDVVETEILGGMAEEDIDVPILDLGADDLHSTHSLSAAIEVITGTDWTQENLENAKESIEQMDEMAEAERVETAEDAEQADEIEEATQSKETTDEIANDEADGGLKDAVLTEKEETEMARKKTDKNNISAFEELETKLTLLEEEMAGFKNYCNVEGFEDNLKNILEKLIVDYNPNGKSERDNVVILGAGKSGKSNLAIEIIKLVNRKRGRRGRKLAKINGEAVNRKGFKTLLNKLMGSDLIIENAHELETETIDEMVECCKSFTDDMMIILEGETESVQVMLYNNPRLSEMFNNVIEIKDYDIKEWVEYGIQYAQKQGYTVDEMAKLAFFKTIDDFFGTNKGISQSDVEMIVEDAISKSKRFGRKISGIFSSKKDDEGLNILVESDFNI